MIEQAAKFRQAQLLAELALADPSRAAEAVALLDAVVKAYPNGRHVVAALDSLARLQLQKGDFAAVEKTIADMAKLPQSADRAAVLRAKVFDKKGDHDKAIAEYDRLIQGSPEGSLRQREARLAKAESLVAIKKFAEAEADVRAVIKAAPAEDYQAQSAAYNTLGDCLRAAGKPKDALLAYLHTDLLYAKDKEQHPRALAHISKLWRELKRDDRADEPGTGSSKSIPRAPGSRPPGPRRRDTARYLVGPLARSIDAALRRARTPCDSAGAGSGRCPEDETQRHAGDQHVARGDAGDRPALDVPGDERQDAGHLDQQAHPAEDRTGGRSHGDLRCGPSHREACHGIRSWAARSPGAARASSSALASRSPLNVSVASSQTSLRPSL